MDAKPGPLLQGTDSQARKHLVELISAIFNPAMPVKTYVWVCYSFQRTWQHRNDNLEGHGPPVISNGTEVFLKNPKSSTPHLQQQQLVPFHHFSPQDKRDKAI